MRVFVSHAGRDRAWAEWVAWQLDHAGRDVTVELDCWDWQAGDDFVARMNTALASCDRMVALFSHAYFEPARWTAQEWTAAFRLAKDRPGFLVPVRLDDTPALPLLGPLIAPALHGLSRERARATLLGALHPVGRPDREPPMPGLGEPVPDQDGGPRLPGVLPSVWGEVPGRNEAFTGRDAMLVQLREGLQGTGRSVINALHGAGGVGKTQLAVEYAWRFAGGYDAVWWVNAEQTDRIDEQYTALATALRLVDPATPVGAAVEALRGWCRGRCGWLVVLDNATTAADIAPWRLPGPGHVLVTSRDPHWPEMATTVEVDVFSRTESVALLRAHLPALPEVDADRLADALGDLPLALAQAAGVLSETRMPTGEYLDLLAQAPAEVLDEGRPLSYPGSLARSVRVAVTTLTNADPAAAQLLGLCGFLAPEPVPTAWFPAAAAAGVLPAPLATTVAAPLAYRRALGLLSRYGLVKLGDGQLSVHRLTQCLLRADDPDPDHTATVVGRVLAGLTLGDLYDPHAWSAWAELLPHLRVLDLAGTDDDQLAWQACQASVYLLRRGEFQAGHDLIQPLHEAWRATSGVTAKRTLWAANYLARSLGELGRPHDAVELERHLLNHYRASAGDDDLNTLASASNLAVTLAELGEHEQARALDQDALDRYRRVLGDDHPDTLRSAHNLANRLAELGEHEQARTLAQDTLDRRRRVLGDDHPDTLTSARNLAVDLDVLGEVEAVARLRQEFGLDDPEGLTRPDVGES